MGLPCNPRRRAAARVGGRRWQATRGDGRAPTDNHTATNQSSIQIRLASLSRPWQPTMALRMGSYSPMRSPPYTTCRCRPAHSGAQAGGWDAAGIAWRSPCSGLCRPGPCWLALQKEAWQAAWPERVGRRCRPGGAPGSRQPGDRASQVLSQQRGHLTATPCVAA